VRRTLAQTLLQECAMSFRITGLSPAPFRHLYGLDDAALAAAGARQPGFPDRIELRDIAPGGSALLLNYVHQPADTPYRASHAIFVREGAEHAYDAVDEIPDALRIRTLSLRAFDADHAMVDADLVEGVDLPTLIARFFVNPAVAYLHAHYARRGCYAARIDRT
jgi:hypothetical protein